MVKYLTPEELICHVLLKPKADDAGEYKKTLLIPCHLQLINEEEEEEEEE